jgi:hypothetical protein
VYLAIAKAAFNKEQSLFTSKSKLNLRKELVKCYICSINTYMELELGFFRK